MPAKKKVPRPRRPKKAPPRYQLRATLAVLALIVFLVLAMGLLSRLTQNLRTPPPPPPVAADPAFAVLIEDLRVEIESALLRSGVSLDRLEIEKARERLYYKVQAPFPTAEQRQELALRLQRVEAALQLVSHPRQKRIDIRHRQDTWITLSYLAPPKPLPAITERPVAVRPRMVIVMDDIGRDLGYVRELLRIDLPVTLSILPGEPYASRSAILAYRQGREVLIHIPMEPQGYPAINPGEDALFVRYSAREIRRRFQGYLERVPYAVGGNNHMGSAFTQSRQGMAVVLKEMKREGLFFLDSVTTGQSVALEEARAVGVPATRRDVFLDNEQEVEAIVRQIRQLTKVVLEKGQAVGICHPYPETLEALRREAAAIRAKGIEVVPLSELIPRGGAKG